MKGRTVGGLLTSGLVALAIALALLQAAVLAHASGPAPITTNTPLAPTNRYSAPGGRAGIPWTPNPPPTKAVPPSERVEFPPLHESGRGIADGQ